MGACGFVCPTRARRAQNGKATTGRRRYRESMIRPPVTRPFAMFLGPAARACPAPTPFLVGARHRLALAPHAPRVQGRNHAVSYLVNPPLFLLARRYAEWPSAFPLAHPCRAGRAR